MPLQTLSSARQLMKHRIKVPNTKEVSGLSSAFPDTSSALIKCFVSFKGLRQNICSLPALIMKDMSTANFAGI